VHDVIGDLFDLGLWARMLHRNNVLRAAQKSDLAEKKRCAAAG
jgi:hypothetical protein